MTVLGLDLGTKCGWAVLNDDGTRVESGVWHCKKGKQPGLRFATFATRLRWALLNYRPTSIGYEQVHRHTGTQAAHVYGGLLGVLLLELHDGPYCIDGWNVGTIKKTATGKGNASKPMMVRAAVQRWGHVKDDNEADALWVALLTLGVSDATKT